MLIAEDFPLKQIGTLIYGRTQSSPVLTASTPSIAAQVTRVLNRMALDERPEMSTRDWLTIQ